MITTQLAVASCVAVALGGGLTAGVLARQTESPDVERHVAAAREAAGTEHTRFFDYLCRAPRRIAARPAASRPPAQPTRRQPPPQSEWYAEPAKVFDNLYFLGTRSLNAWALTTSGGIVIIDPLYDYNVEAEIIEGLRTLGLDPADITHVLVSHGHGDHYGGAQQLQRQFGASVLLSAPDWDMMLANPGRQPQPTRDIEVTDGQQLSVGDTQLTFTLTPGHTPGTISTLVPVRDGGRSHIAALWGGTAMRHTEEFYTQYIAGAQTFAAMAADAGADVVISNHAIFDRADEKIEALARRNAGDPHPFVIGEAATQNMFEMIQHCAQAGLARLAQ